VCLYERYTDNKIYIITNTNSNNKNTLLSVAAALDDAAPTLLSGSTVPAPVEQVNAFFWYIYMEIFKNNVRSETN